MGRFEIWMAAVVAFGVVAAGLAVVSPGCTPAQYAKQADKVAYGTVRDGQRVALGTSQPFDITYKPYAASQPNSVPAVMVVNGKTICLQAESQTSGPLTAPLTRPASQAAVSATTTQSASPPGAQILSVDDCLMIAFRNSRAFQTRKENLYVSALVLANTARTWNWHLLTGDIPAQASISSVNEGAQVQSGTIGPNVSLMQRFVDGGILTLGMAVNAATDFTHADNTIAGSLLSANFTQPLLQGAWRGFAYEPQYRLERDFLISVFDYERFTQTFGADIVTRYYAVLQQRDLLENEAASIERLKRTFALTSVLVKGGQASLIQQDQAEQNLLNAEIRFEQDLQSYRNALDNYKLTIGLPVAANVDLDFPNALTVLQEVGPKGIAFPESEALEIALAVRPDVLTQRAAVRDADRDVEIAADQFNPQLNLALGINAPSKPPQQFENIQFNKHVRTASATFDYQLDQTTNRDKYRDSLINYEQAKRNYTLFLDTVRVEVRQAYRQLVQSRNSYELQLRNVAIAKRRTKLAAIQQKEGQASARDVLEAEDALRAAQDGLTDSLVTYMNTRLQFLARLGMLWVDERGLLHERDAPFTHAALRNRYRMNWEPTSP